MSKYKLICIGGNSIELPVNKDLRRAYMYYRGCNYIIAPKSLPTRKTRSIHRVEDLPESCIKLVDEISANYNTDEYIIIIDTRFDKNEVKLFTPELAKKEIDADHILYGPSEEMRNTHPIEERFYDTVLFSIGRTNGPTSKVTFDQVYDNYRYRFDVNSRIEVSTITSPDEKYVLTFTFKSEKLRNMAKIVLPNKQIVILMQNEFDLWGLGLLILTKQIDKLSERISNLFTVAQNKWNKFNKPIYE